MSINKGLCEKPNPIETGLEHHVTKSDQTETIFIFAFPINQYFKISTKEEYRLPFTNVN